MRVWGPYAILVRNCIWLPRNAADLVNAAPGPFMLKIPVGESENQSISINFWFELFVLPALSQPLGSQWWYSCFLPTLTVSGRVSAGIRWYPKESCKRPVIALLMEMCLGFRVPKMPSSNPQTPSHSGLYIYFLFPWHFWIRSDM